VSQITSGGEPTRYPCDGDHEMSDLGACMECGAEPSNYRPVFDDLFEARPRAHTEPDRNRIAPGARGGGTTRGERTMTSDTVAEIMEDAEQARGVPYACSEA
jgi:hypothetical protein